VVVGSFFQTKFRTFRKDELYPNESGAEGTGRNGSISSAGFFYSKSSYISSFMSLGI